MSVLYLVGIFLYAIGIIVLSYGLNVASYILVGGGLLCLVFDLIIDFKNEGKK